MDNDGVSKKILIFVTEFSDILLHMSRQGDQQIALKQVHFSADTSYEINFFKRYNKIMAECEDVCIRKKTKLGRMMDFTET